MKYVGPVLIIAVIVLGRRWLHARWPDNPTKVDIIFLGALLAIYAILAVVARVVQRMADRVNPPNHSDDGA